MISKVLLDHYASKKHAITFIEKKTKNKKKEKSRKIPKKESRKMRESW